MYTVFFGKNCCNKFLCRGLSDTACNRNLFMIDAVVVCFCKLSDSFYRIFNYDSSTTLIIYLLGNTFAKNTAAPRRKCRTYIVVSVNSFTAKRDKERALCALS